MDERYQQGFPVSWEQFHRDARALAWRLKGHGDWQAIVCITRGGLVPAAVVARELGVRVIETICVASYDYDKQGEIQVLKEVGSDIVGLGGGDGAGVLIVDDLVDTGKTAKGCPVAVAKGAFCNRLCQTGRSSAGRHVHYGSEPGHLDLSALGHGAAVHAAADRRQHRLRRSVRIIRPCRRRQASSRSCRRCRPR